MIKHLGEVPAFIPVDLSGVASFAKKVRDRVEAAAREGGWIVVWRGVGQKEIALILELHRPDLAPAG